jgi:hypothetical protein
LPRRSQVRALTLTRGNFDYTLSGIEPSLDFFRELVMTGSKENFNVHAPIGAQICNAAISGVGADSVWKLGARPDGLDKYQSCSVGADSPNRHQHQSTVGFSSDRFDQAC